MVRWSYVRLVVAAALCGVAAAAAGQATGAAAPTDEVTEHVHGVVIGSVDKKPIARALVSSGDQRLAVMTDTEGRFSFDIRHPAKGSSLSLRSTILGRDYSQMMSLFLNVRKQGYTQGSFPVQISFADQPDLQLKLVPEGVLRGRVTVSGGELPEGMFVQLRRKQVQDGVAMWVQANGTQTNSRGEFRFAELQPGEYKVTTQAWIDRRGAVPASLMQTHGFAPSFGGDARDLASAMPIRVNAGETVQADVTLRGAIFYRVSIPVRGMTQGAGMNVMVGDGTAGYSLQLNARTGLAEGFLPSGAYDVQAISFGQPQGVGRGRVEVAGMAVEGTPIQVVANGKIAVHVREEFTAKEPETGGRGVVTMSGGLGSRMARTMDISLRSMSGMVQQSGATLGNNRDDPTNLTLENVSEGEYRVVANAYRGYIASVTSDGVDLLRKPLSVGPGGVSAAIEVTIRDDGATLTGTVPTADSNTQPTLVYFIPLGDEMGRTMQQFGAFQGKFTLQNMAPGRYLVLASKEQLMQQLEYRNEEALHPYMSKGTMVTLVAGQKAEIQVPSMVDGE